MFRMTFRVVLIAALAAIAGACAGPAASPSPSLTPSPSATASPSPAPTPSGPLLTIESRGGRCVGGPCGRTLYLDFDGRVHEAAKPPNDLGFIEPDMVAALEQAIGDADFDEIRSRPFTGTCPTAVDGQELVLEFATSDGVENIASCEVAIDWSSPLFVTVTTVMDQWFGH